MNSSCEQVDLPAPRVPPNQHGRSQIAQTLPGSRKKPIVASSTRSESGRSGVAVRDICYALGVALCDCLC